MRARSLVTVLAAAMAVSWFLPWIDTAVGRLSPSDGFADFDWARVTQAPPLTLAFLASFALPALLCLLSLMGWAPRLLALIAGVLPFAIAGYIWLSARDRLDAFGLPPQALDDLGRLLDQFHDLLGIGIYLYAGGALLLLVVGLLGPAD
jgi:hypothetical protein